MVSLRFTTGYYLSSLWDFGLPCLWHFWYWERRFLTAGLLERGAWVAGQLKAAPPWGRLFFAFDIAYHFWHDALHILVGSGGGVVHLGGEGFDGI